MPTPETETAGWMASVLGADLSDSDIPQDGSGVGMTSTDDSTTVDRLPEVEGLSSQKPLWTWVPCSTVNAESSISVADPEAAPDLSCERHPSPVLGEEAAKSTPSSASISRKDTSSSNASRTERPRPPKPGSLSRRKRRLSPLRLRPPRRDVADIGRDDVFSMCTAFLDQAAQQPCRPLMCLFWDYPSTPSRQQYRLRMCVNLLYYARNYANWTIAAALLACLWRPCYALLLLLAVATRVMNRMSARPRPATVTRAQSAKPPSLSSPSAPPPAPRMMPLEVCLMRAMQLTAWMLVLNYVGLRLALTLVLSFCIPIVAHAFFMPFSDEAFANYTRTMQRCDIPIAVPRSPTQDLERVDPSFEPAFSPNVPELADTVFPSD